MSRPTEINASRTVRQSRNPGGWAHLRNVQKVDRDVPARWKCPGRRSPVVCTFRRCACGGFSLLELMVVIAIVAILSGLTMLAFGNILVSSRLDMAARSLVADIDFARQAAATRNENIQLRFFKSVRPDSGGPEVFWQWQVGMLDKSDPEVFQPLRPKTSLPNAVVLDESTTHSPLLLHAPVAEGSSEPALTFRPNGELEPLAGLPFANLPDWCLTIVPERKLGKSIAEIEDFISVQIDPLTSRTRQFRP